MAWWKPWKKKELPMTPGTIPGQVGTDIGGTPVFESGGTTKEMAGVVGKTQTAYKPPTWFGSGGGGAVGDAVRITSVGGGISPQQVKQIHAQKMQQIQQQQVAQQLAQQKLIQQAVVSRGTISRPTYTTPTTKVHPPGTVYDVQTETFKIKGKQKHIPITETYTVGKDWTSRKATEEEKKQLREYQTAEAWKEIATEEPPSRIKFELSEAYGKYKDFASEEVLSPEKTKVFFSKAGKPGEFMGGAIYGAVGTKGAIIRTGLVTGATAGAGFLIGAGTRGAMVGTTAIAGAKAGAVVGTGIKLGTYGVGGYYTGKYIIGTAQQVYEAPTIFEKGKITGRAGVDIGAGIYGFKLGAKGWQKTEGLIRTRGMKDITKVATDPYVESGKRSFVEIDKQLYSKLSQQQRAKLYKKMFEGDYPKIIKLKDYTGKGIKIKYTKDIPIRLEKGTDLQRALGVQRGGVHAADMPGDYSELTRAMHIAPKVSTRFLGVGGKDYKLFPSVKDILSPPTEPGVVWFETPKGFKVMKGFEYKRGTYKWYGKLTSGEKAYIPGSKPEIEAIFDPGVTPGFEPVPYTKTYIVTQGVRVPVTGAYKPITTGKITEAIISPVEMSKILTTTSSQYTPPAFIDVTAGLVSVYKPSKISYAPSQVSYISTPSKVSYAPAYVKPSISYAPTSSKVISSLAPSTSSIISSAKVSKPLSRKMPSRLSSSSIFRSYKKPAYISYPTRKRHPTIIHPFKTKPLKLPKPSKRIEVYGKRFGKWKVIGYGKTEKEAYHRGKEWASQTLGASFRVPKGKRLKLPKYRTKISEGFVTFIEPRKRRLTKGTLELPEILYHKKAKGGRRKKK